MYIRYAKAGAESATKLAQALGVQATDANHEGNYGGAVVFNYGSSRLNKTAKWINDPLAVRKSIDKVYTLCLLHANQIPALEFTVYKDLIPESWTGDVVVRSKVDGKENEGLDYHVGSLKTVPDAPLYTRYWKHKFEFRIVVYKGKVIGRYLKQRNKEEEWEFESMDAAGFESIDRASIQAAKALGLDYAGIDVLSRDSEKFRVLEVNSAPIITDEVIKFFKKEFA